ncbi:MAG: microcystin degradation protein MlrC [Paracoccus denitrificans]|nr:MAG: microcystin degradation protein MlrC [Paracoccus denitrificans]PZO84864.1 MAG: microcystin degradation protein MlrC [Paracoccus denitrificans]
MRVAIGGLHTECSTYSPLHQQAADFTRLEGDALLDMAGVDDDWAGVTAVPIFHDRSVPGGPVAADLYAAQRAEFMARIRAALPLDGVLLVMHGAYFVPGVDDPEGDFIAELRQIVGPDTIISSAWDLHGQITRQITDTVDAFAAFRTAPHIDQPQTRKRAAKMLLDALQGGPRPQVVRRAIPLLVSGEMSSTFVEPCQSLYAQLPHMDAQPGVLDANLMVGYVWADSPRATAAAVVTCTDAAEGRAAADAIANAYWSVRYELVSDMETGQLDDLLDRITFPAILADSGDNPTAGGVGDRADVLAALIRRGFTEPGAPGSVIAGIAAPAAVAALRGGAREITVGDALGGGGPVVTLQPDEVQDFGDELVLRKGPMSLVLTARRRPFHNLSDFSALGLNPGETDLIVVKSGYLSPDLRELPVRQVMALTNGAVCQNLTAQENLHRPRPTWPFQTDV